MALSAAAATLASGLAGAGVSLFGNVLGNTFGFLNQSGANDTNLQIARETNAMNVGLVAAQNQANYALQQEQWARDDSAYQRMVKDMQAAGLNPLSGGSPSSSPLSAQMQAAQMQAASVNPYNFDLSFVNALPDLLLKSRMLEQRDREIDLDYIKSGLSPEDSSSVDSLASDYRSALQALGSLRSNQSQEAAKNAGSPYVKGEGILSQSAKDLSSVAKTGVNVLDTVLNSRGKTVTGEKMPLVDRSGQAALKGDNKSVESYYYNKAHSNKLSFKQRLKNRFNKFLNSGK